VNKSTFHVDDDMSEVLIYMADFLFCLLTSRWFWIALGISVVCGCLTFAYRKMKLCTLEKIVYNRSFSTDGIFVGETLELVETISNPTWFPLFAVRIEFFMPSGLTVDDVKCNEYTRLTSIFNIPPYSTVKKTHVVKADRRDHYKLFTSYIRYRKAEYTYDSWLDFYAYPNGYDGDESFSPDIYRAGEIIANRKYIEDPFFISDIRNYRLGDPMRSINFKASVRSLSGGTRCLMTNEYDSSRNYDSMIFLDLSPYSEADIEERAQVELGLRYACYLFGRGVNNGGSIGFSTNCAVGSARYIHIPCGSGELHTKRILEHFAEISPCAKKDYSITTILKKYAPQLSLETDIYLITPFVDDKMSEILSVLRHTGRTVQVIPLIGGVFE